MNDVIFFSIAGVEFKKGTDIELNYGYCLSKTNKKHKVTEFPIAYFVDGTLERKREAMHYQVDTFFNAYIESKNKKNQFKVIKK